MNYTSSVDPLSIFATSQAICGPADPIGKSTQTFNNTSTGTNNTSCMLNLSEAEEETLEFDVLNKIQHYYFLETRIWRILPPILLGKK